MRRPTILIACVLSIVGITMTRAAELAAQVVRTEAIAGSPLGVGTIELRVPQGQAPPQTGLRGVELLDRDGRIFYPAIEVREIPGVVTDIFSESRRPLGRFIGSILESQAPTVVIHFLFEGDRPLNVTLLTATPQRATLVPRRDPKAYGRLVERWWRRYSAVPGLLEPKDDYPPIVDNYLETMLAHRFELPPVGPDAGSAPADSWQNDFSQQMGLALDPQPFLLAIQRARFEAPRPYLERATQLLPDPLLSDAATERSGPLEPQPVDVPEIEVEPLAMRVPKTCFYVRFGSFSNFLWFQDTLKTWGGDVQNLVALRGLDYGMTARIEDQLALKQGALARWFGESVIADVAFIGTDTFVKDGASFGLLFEAKNSLLLSADFMRQRQERADADPRATLETIEIEGRRVSLLTTPDGATRSYYASVDEFHLVTRSEAIVRAFLTLDPEADSLGSLPEFRQQRKEAPPSQENTIFAYFSQAFLLNASSPAYRIATVRRMQAMADIQLVELARLAAQGEGRPHATIDDLIAGQYLPPSFGPRPDGAQTILESDGAVYDSVWGRPGQMLPLADMTIDQVTPSEAADYRRFCDYFHEHWAALDPIVAVIRHEDIENNEMRATIDLRMTPLSVQNYDRIATVVGDPQSARLESIPGNIGGFELVLRDAHWFGGLRDVRLALGQRSKPPGVAESVVQQLAPGRIFRDFLVGYLGAVDGRLGWMRILDIGFPPADPRGGLDSTPLGRWRLVYQRFTLYSFQRDLLIDAAPRLGFEPTDHPSQFWLNVGDVSRAQITPTLNNLLYGRTRETSAGNLRLMQSLRQQLHVPASDCKDVAERLLGAKLICPLGGDYVFDAARRRWFSTAPFHATAGGLLQAQAPAGFVAPPLNWFRGLDAQVRFDPRAVDAHAVILMEKIGNGSE